MVCEPGPVINPQVSWAAEGEPRRRRRREAEVLGRPLAAFEAQRLGYVFTHKPLLVEALTHASYSAAATPCYQRLEYLGDAVLDYIVSCLKHFVRECFTLILSPFESLYFC